MADGERNFYVGYRPEAPPDLARFIKRVVLALLIAAPLLAVLVVALQSPFANSFFEFGDVREFEGRILSAPHPILQVKRPGPRGSDPQSRETGLLETHLLVAAGKHGADEAIAGLDGHAVKLEGQRIYRGDSKMIELGAAGIVDLGALPGDLAAGERSLGEHRFVGEIVDSKCHLGVMKPGNGKTHRACAARCISGGAPPMLWVRDRAGLERQFLLVGRDGRQLNDEVLGIVAEPVQVAGEVVSRGDLWLLRTEPSQITRLESDGD